MPRKLNLGKTMKIILLAVVFILVSGCSTTSTENISQSSMLKVEKQVLQKGIFLTTDCERTAYDDCLCKADISYPILSGLDSETAQIEFNQTFKKVAEEYKCDGKPTILTKIAEDMMTNKRDEIALNYEVTFESPEILSILNYGFTFGAGAAHANEFAKGFILDIVSGKKLSAKDIFGENIDHVNQVIYEKLIPIAFPEDLKKRKGKFIERDICNDCSLFLSKEGIKIIWDKYAVTGGAAGNPDVLIPNKYITYPAIAHYFK
jgi:hypothetical protein